MRKLSIYLIVMISFGGLFLPTLVNAQEISFDDTILVYDGLELEPIGSDNINCNSIFVKNGEYNSLYHVMQDAFTLIKFAAPILVIVLSSMDYIKAITSHDAEDLKKANVKFVKRLVIGVIIFLLPFLLDFLFEAFGLFDLNTCGIGK